jgi:hypothetical protein
MNLRIRCSVLILSGLILNARSAFAEQAPATTDAASVPPPADSPPPPPPAPVLVPETPPPAPMAPMAAGAPPSTLIAPAAPPLKIEGPSGSTIRFGLLLQPQFQSVSSPALDSYSNNLYLRRARILVGGTLFGVVDFFVDTDYPNLFLNNVNAGTAAMPVFEKNTPGMNIQDAFATVKLIGDHLKIDAGYMLPPMSHNAVQGATTLYSWDYFSYTFQHGESFGSSGNPVGRDVGVELRGLVLDGHLEYRAGLFQGLRQNQDATDVAARNFFRATARVQINLLDAEPGFFYAGTYLGAKKIASIGGSYDIQNDYRYFAVDGFVDLPAGPGVATAQVNLAHWNGEGFLPALPKQTALMGEAGYNIAALQLSPIVRYEHIWGNTNGAGVTQVSQTHYAIGAGFWPYGHNTNLKLFYSRVKTDGVADGFNQINLQWQIYFY